MVEFRQHEQKTLLTLDRLGGKADVDHVAKTSGLAHAAVMRAALTLSERSFVQLSEYKQIVATLNEEGKDYARKGLPERRLVTALTNLGGTAEIDKVVRKADVEKHVVPIALGWLRRKGWAKMEEERKLKILGEAARGEDEELLEVLAQAGSTIVGGLSDKQREAIETLKKRKLLELQEKVVRTLVLTQKGKELVEEGIEAAEETSQLTPELILTEKWRKTKLRKFNVAAPGPLTYPGKAHPLQQIIERAKEIFLEMGFTEIRGPLVETAFWNFDALFQPQDHPAREMMDTFYVSVPKAGRLPGKGVVNAVAKTHEEGWTTGSRGWGYKWNRNEARRLVLRTHTTAETIRYLARHKKPPIKIFSVDRVYRNEQVTDIHTAEFHQIEGIVVDKGVTLRDLMGTLKTFYVRFGLKKVQFWPCYFPYTEPSAQAIVYVPKLKRWMELCGMGMFRPEVLAPMGIKYPVLAWGGGLERIAMLELGLEDIRLLYGNRLGWIRRTPLCQ